jgi:hypothetical protein
MTDAVRKLDRRDLPYRIDRDWAVAWRRAAKRFTKCGIEPDLSVGPQRSCLNCGSADLISPIGFGKTKRPATRPGGARRGFVLEAAAP